ncbi:hypothetical protein DBR06_SOUSAS10510117, partial [Sousa chinensis]
TVLNFQSHVFSFHEEKPQFICEHSVCGKRFAMKHS